MNVCKNRKKREGATEGSVKQKAARAACLGMICAAVSLTGPVTAFAANANANAVLAPLNNLKTLLTSVVAAIGVIVIVKNIMEVSSAIQNQDTAGITSALKGLAGGILMAFVGTVLTILGV